MSVTPSQFSIILPGCNYRPVYLHLLIDKATPGVHPGPPPLSPVWRHVPSPGRCHRGRARSPLTRTSPQGWQRGSEGTQSSGGVSLHPTTPGVTADGVCWWLLGTLLRTGRVFWLPKCLCSPTCPHPASRSWVLGGGFSPKLGTPALPNLPHVPAALPSDLLGWGSPVPPRTLAHPGVLPSAPRPPLGALAHPTGAPAHPSPSPTPGCSWASLSPRTPPGCSRPPPPRPPRPPQGAPRLPSPTPRFPPRFGAGPPWFYAAPFPGFAPKPKDFKCFLAGFLPSGDSSGPLYPAP